MIVSTSTVEYLIVKNKENDPNWVTPANFSIAVLNFYATGSTTIDNLIPADLFTVLSSQKLVGYVSKNSQIEVEFRNGV
jgi:hypothetical protein